MSKSKEYFLFCTECKGACFTDTDNFDAFCNCRPHEDIDVLQDKNNSLKAQLSLLKDKHCGVLIGPSRTPCLRSLLCKSHSLNSKMAVVGRSRPLDELLADFENSNNLSMQNISLTETTIRTKLELHTINRVNCSFHDYNDEITCVSMQHYFSRVFDNYNIERNYN